MVSLGDMLHLLQGWLAGWFAGWFTGCPYYGQLHCCHCYKGAGAVACQMQVCLPTHLTSQLEHLLLAHSGTCSALRFLVTHMFLTATIVSLWRAMTASNGQDELLDDGVSL